MALDAHYVSFLVHRASCITLDMLHFKCHSRHMRHRRCHSVSIAPLYSHVQSHYWNVGFMRYWTIQQVKQLTDPAIGGSACSALSFCHEDYCRSPTFCLPRPACCCVTLRVGERAGIYVNDYENATACHEHEAQSLHSDYSKVFSDAVAGGPCPSSSTLFAGVRSFGVRVRSSLQV